MEAVTAAMSVLGWFELPEDQVPPEEYWQSADLVEDWFKAVKRRQGDRKKGFESIEDPEDDEDYVDEDAAALRG